MSVPSAAPIIATDVHHQLGVLTRQLHDSLNGLGLADKLKNWSGELPDAKSRLSYIARLTGEAAEKVLNQVDQAKVQNDLVTQQAQRLQTLLEQHPNQPLVREDVAAAVTGLAQSSQLVDSHLTEIMMAQDFHDLTGQVIAKVVALAATIEEQLVLLLIQTAPADAPVKAAAPAAPYVPALSGPVVSAQGNPDVVTDQSQVDDLLASLGF